MAELVDALGLGSSDESCGGSSPSARTIFEVLRILGAVSDTKAKNDHAGYQYALGRFEARV